MPIKQDTFNLRLYDFLKSWGYRPIPIDSKGQNAPVPQEADVFKFTFTKDGKDIGDVWVTVDQGKKVIVYFDDEVADSDEINTSLDKDFNNSWMGFLHSLKNWAFRKQLQFEPKNKDHLAADMAQREHMKKKEQLGESYHPLGKKISYSNDIPTVKIILQHNRALEENDQRFRHIEKIFVENINGERFLIPTNRPGLAKVYARHIAEGGTPYDDKAKHINSIVEEYTKMAGFIRATKNSQFNESAQKLVNLGTTHYTQLRETLTKMISRRGYSKYFENYTPILNEEETDTSLSELFVKETLDPRIESVMPILSKLSKNLNEMEEVKELDNWADNLIAEKLETENLEKKNLDETATKRYVVYKGDLPINQTDDYQEALGQFEKTLKRFPREVLYIIDQNTKKIRRSNKPMGKDISTSQRDKEADEISKKYGYDTNRNPNQTDTRDVEDFWNISRLAGLGLEENRLEEEKQFYLVVKKDSNLAVGTWDGITFKPFDRSKYPAGQMDKIPADCEVDKIDGPVGSKEIGLAKIGLKEKLKDLDEGSTKASMHDDAENMSLKEFLIKYGDDDLAREFWHTVNGVDEGLDTNQKRAGQLGPTEPVGKNEKNLRGKLVGASESTETKEEAITEMDSEGHRGHREDGDPYAKGAKATPAKVKDVAKKGAKELDKAFDKAHDKKKDVKEGQEDLEAILKIVRK